MKNKTLKFEERALGKVEVVGIGKMVRSADKQQKDLTFNFLVLLREKDSKYFCICLNTAHIDSGNNLKDVALSVLTDVTSSIEDYIETKGFEKFYEVYNQQRCAHLWAYYEQVESEIHKFEISKTHDIKAPTTSEVESAITGFKSFSTELKNKIIFVNNPPLELCGVL